MSDTTELTYRPIEPTFGHDGRKKAARCPSGVIAPAREAMPSAEQFGRYGWSTGFSRTTYETPSQAPPGWRQVNSPIDQIRQETLIRYGQSSKAAQDAIPP